VSQSFTSRNDPAPFAGNSVPTRLASVQYNGPSVRGAAVIWHAIFDQLIVTNITSVGLCFKATPSTGRLLFEDFSIISNAAQVFGRGSGVAVLDLEPGQVMELIGYTDDPAALQLARDGFTVVVL